MGPRTKYTKRYHEDQDINRPPQTWTTYDKDSSDIDLEDEDFRIEDQQRSLKRGLDNSQESIQITSESLQRARVLLGLVVKINWCCREGSVILSSISSTAAYNT